MFSHTEKMRQQLETELAQWGFAKKRAQEAVNAERALLYWKHAEYRRGRVEGIRLALEICAQTFRKEIVEEKQQRWCQYQDRCVHAKTVEQMNSECNSCITHCNFKWEEGR